MKTAAILSLLILAGCCEPSGRGCIEQPNPAFDKFVKDQDDCIRSGNITGSKYDACMRRNGHNI